MGGAVTQGYGNERPKEVEEANELEPYIDLRPMILAAGIMELVQRGIVPRHDNIITTARDGTPSPEVTGWYYQDLWQQDPSFQLDILTAAIGTGNSDIVLSITRGHELAWEVTIMGPYQAILWSRHQYLRLSI